MTFGSCFKYKPDRHGTCLAMNRNRFIVGMLDSSQRLLIQFVIPVWYCSHGNRSKTAVRACSSSGLEKVSSLRLVFLLSSDDPGPWDPRDPAAVEPLLRPSMFHDLAESEPLETDVAFVSILHVRAVRELTFSVRVLTFCSNAANDAILAERALTVCSTLAWQLWKWPSPRLHWGSWRGCQNLRIHARDVTKYLGALWTVRRTCGKEEWKMAVFLESPSVNVWFHTMNRPSSGSQMLKSPKITPTPLGHVGQCGWIRRNLPRNCLKESSGSKWTLTKTKLCRPDWMLTRWSRPWQVIKCVTRASWGRGSRWMQIADTPAFSL